MGKTILVMVQGVAAAFMLVFCMVEYSARGKKGG